MLGHQHRGSQLWKAASRSGVSTLARHNFRSLSLPLHGKPYHVANGGAKLVILSSNCPEETVAVAKNGDTPVYSFSENNAVLGAACGKPFPVSIIAILDGGKSDILNLKAN